MINRTLRQTRSAPLLFIIVLLGITYTCTGTTRFSCTLSRAPPSFRSIDLNAFQGDLPTPAVGQPELSAGGVDLHCGGRRFGARIDRNSLIFFGKVWPAFNLQLLWEKQVLPRLELRQTRN